MSSETTSHHLNQTLPSPTRRQLGRKLVSLAIFGCCLGVSALAHAEPGASDSDDLPPRVLDVAEEQGAAAAKVAIEDAQEDLEEAAEAIAPDSAGESGGLPAEEPVATQVSTAQSKLPSADELLAGTPQAIQDREPTEEEVAKDLAMQEKEDEDAVEASTTPTPENDAEPEEEGARRWSFLDDLQDIQALIDADRQVELMRSGAAHGEGYDLSPYVREQSWHDAMTLMREGECKKALELVAKQVETYDAQPAGVQFGVAKIHACSGAQGARDAKKMYQELAKQEGIVSELAKLELGLPVAKRDAGSEQDMETVTFMVKVKAARALASKKGQLDEGLEQLARLRASASSSWSWYKIRLYEAELLEDADRIEDAGQVWLSIYLRTRDWRSGAQIEDTVEKFERRHKVQVLGLGERADRVRELVARGRYKEAQKANAELVKWAKLDNKQIRAWSNYRKALEAERKKDRELAVSLFEKAEKDMTRGEGRLRLYFGWARALRRLDRDDEAIALYDRMCEDYPAEDLCADGMYEAGRLLQYQNKHELASAHFERLVGLFPDHRDVPDALWRAAFSLYLEGKYEAVDPVLEHLRDFHGDHRDESELTLGLKAQYWLGVAALKRGDRFEAMTALQKTIDRGPLTWYGRLAVERLEEMGIKPLEMLPSRQLSIDDLRHLEGVHLPKDERMARAAEYIRIGLYDMASAEVSKKLRLHPAPEGAERVLASLHLAMGRPDLGHWNMKRHLRDGWPTKETLRDWATAFPLDYMEYAHAWGMKYSVDPFLVQAIIRQESGFREQVKSYAGAVGLMQLMPGTARYTARVFLESEEGQSYRKKDLLTPEKNIQLGSMYVRVHTAHASDHVALALAGYNAGAKPLKRWVSQYGDRELDAWVESITYREARGYVRKVMTSYLRYSWLYGGGKMPKIGLHVPEKLRDWGEVPEVGTQEVTGPVSMLMIGPEKPTLQ